MNIFTCCNAQGGRTFGSLDAIDLPVNTRQARQRRFSPAGFVQAPLILDNACQDLFKLLEHTHLPSGVAGSGSMANNSRKVHTIKCR